MSRSHPRVLTEGQAKWLLTLFPPLLFNRIRVLEFGPGFRTCRVRVARSLFTRNLNGTTFGGTIFSAADPFHAVMYWQICARRGTSVEVWLRRARVDYLAPATTALTLDFAISDDEVEQAIDRLGRLGRHAPLHRVRAVDAAGKICAIVETDLYLRSTREREGGLSAF